MASILVLDDDPDVLLVVADSLRLAGHEVAAITRPAELPKHLGDGADLIVLDLDMPETSGFEVLEQLGRSEATRGIPVVFLSAHDEAAFRVEGLKRGAVDFVGKPFDPDELVLRVELALSRRVALGSSSDPESGSAPGFIDRYRIVRKLGEGAFGRVFEAEDPRLDRRVAIKLLSTDTPAGSSMTAALRREQKVLARLSHRHIVQVYDAGEVGGTPYFVMEWIDGSSLAEPNLLATLDSMRRRLQIVWAVAQGLEHAHSREVVHCDVKPGNILVAKNGECKLTDFGLSNLARQLRSGERAAPAGTPRYAAPEVGLHSGPTSASDVFSLGCVLYELLTGMRAFRPSPSADRHAFTLTAVEDVTPPRILNPSISAHLNDLVVSMLDPIAANRPTSAEVCVQLKDEIER